MCELAKWQKIVLKIMLASNYEIEHKYKLMTRSEITSVIIFGWVLIICAMSLVYFLVISKL